MARTRCRRGVGDGLVSARHKVVEDGARWRQYRPTAWTAVDRAGPVGAAYLSARRPSGRPRISHTLYFDQPGVPVSS